MRTTNASKPRPPDVPDLAEIAADPYLHVIHVLERPGVPGVPDLASFEPITGSVTVVARGSRGSYERPAGGVLAGTMAFRRRPRERLHSAAEMLDWARRNLHGFTLLGEVAS